MEQGDAPSIVDKSLREGDKVTKESKIRAKTIYRFLHRRRRQLLNGRFGRIKVCLTHFSSFRWNRPHPLFLDGSLGVESSKASLRLCIFLFSSRRALPLLNERGHNNSWRVRRGAYSSQSTRAWVPYGQYNALAASSITLASSIKKAVLGDSVSSLGTIFIP